MIQYIIVGVVLLAAIAYVARQLVRIFKVKNNACGGCRGCDIKRQIMRNKTQEIKNKTQRCCNY